MVNKLFFVLLASLLASSPAAGDTCKRDGQGCSARDGLLYSGNAVSPNVARIMAQQSVRRARMRERLERCRAGCPPVPMASRFSAKAIHEESIKLGLIAADTPFINDGPIWMEKTRKKLENAQQIENAFNMQQLKKIPIAGFSKITKETLKGNNIKYIDPNGNVNTLYCRGTCTM